MCPCPAGILVTQGDGTIDVSAVFTDIAGDASAATVLALVASGRSTSECTLGEHRVRRRLHRCLYLRVVLPPFLANGKAEIKGNAPDGGYLRMTLTNENGNSLVLPTIAVSGGAWTAEPTAARCWRWVRVVSPSMRFTPTPRARRLRQRRPSLFLTRPCLRSRGFPVPTPWRPVRPTHAACLPVD